MQISNQTVSNPIRWSMKSIVHPTTWESSQTYKWESNEEQGPRIELSSSIMLEPFQHHESYDIFIKTQSWYHKSLLKTNIRHIVKAYQAKLENKLTIANINLLNKKAQVTQVNHAKLINYTIEALMSRIAIKYQETPNLATINQAKSSNWAFKQ